MADKLLNFMHPTTGAKLPVTLDDGLTGSDVVSLLIGNNFIVPNRVGYDLGLKGGAMLKADQPLASAGVKDGDTLRVIHPTEAGGGIPGLDAGSVMKFNVAELRRSPPALTMAIRLYDDLEYRYLCLNADMEVEKFKSTSRLTASLLLLVAQVVIAVGASVLPTNSTVGAVVLCAGGLQALLATYLTFRVPHKNSVPTRR
jgi:hypothetical protein